MIRNLKILMAAAMALAAFGAFSASGASAAGEQFHCNVAAGSFCKATVFPDGTGKNSHHVLIIKKGVSSGSITCNGLVADATQGPTAKELTLTGLDYNFLGGCNLAGSPGTIDMNGCDFLFTSEGGVVHVVCPPGKVIELTAGACVVTFGSQTLTGITYTNINAKKEVTVSTNVKKIHGIAHAGCLGLLGFTGTITEGEYSTGNTIVKGYKDGSAHTEANQVNIWWE